MIMSLFLLVSIGSVCAEDITADADIQSTDVESVDILADESDNPIGEDTSEKINTTVTVGDYKEKYDYDEDKNITVNVKDNESQNIDVNESELNVFEGNTSIGFTYNNSIISITDTLSVGIHNLTINYLGNANYTESSTNFLLKIMGNTTLSIPETIVSDGANVEVHLDIFDGVEHLTVDKSKVNLNLTYIDGEGNVQSKIIEQNEFTIENNTVKFITNVIGTDINLLRSNLTVNYTEAVDPKTARIILTTRVGATAEPRIRDTEDKNITVHVYDGQNHELTITKSDLKIFDNGKEVTNFKLNGSVITISSLAIGEHNLTIKFNNVDYNSSSKDIKIKVWGNETFSPQATANVDANKDVYITLNLSDGVDPVNVDASKLNVTLFYTVGNNTFNRTNLPIALFDTQTISLHVPEEFDSAYVDIKYAAKESNLTAKTTIKVDTSIVVPASMEEPAGKVIEFIAKVYLANGTAINVTVNNTKVYSNGKEIKFTYNDSSIILNDTFKFGVYNITVKYLGTQTYSEVAKSFILTVYGINATSSVDVNSTKKGQKDIQINIVKGNETVEFTKDELNITVTTKDGNDTKVIPVNWTLENGNITFILDNINFTTATLNIKYNQTEFNVTLNRIYNVNIEVINLENEYLDGNFTFRLVDVDDNNAPVKGKKVSLMLKGNISVGHSATTDDNGIATFKNANLYIFDQSFTMKRVEVGLHPIDVSTDGNVKSTKLTTNLTVTKANIKIVIDPYKEYWGSTKKVKITVTNANSGNPISGIILDLYMPKTAKQHYYVQTDSNGISEIGASGLSSGDYEVTVSNNDTQNINAKSAKTTIKILQKPVKIDVKASDMYYNSGKTATIKITDKSTGKAIAGVYFLVQLDKNSKKTYLFQTNSKGELTFSDSLAVGKHTIVVATADTRYTGSTVTKTFTVKKASATIKAKKVTDYYKGVKYFTIKLVNSKNKKAIYDAKINVKIFTSKNKYYNYDGKTGANGQIRLMLDTLKPGKYKVVVSGNDNKNFAAKNVTSKIVIKKAPTKLTPKKLKAKKGAKKYFKVKVTNKKTKKVMKGVKIKIKVYTGKKAKTYTAKSNAKGIAKILTNKLKVGKHKVVVTSANKYCVAKKAKSTIKIKK